MEGWGLGGPLTLLQTARGRTGLPAGRPWGLAPGRSLVIERSVAIGGNLVIRGQNSLIIRLPEPDCLKDIHGHKSTLCVSIGLPAWRLRTC